MSDTTLVIGATYRYALWTFNECNPTAFSTASVTAEASPSMPGPPAPPSQLSATPGAHRIRLAWSNPTGPTHAETFVRRDSVGFPSGPFDGVPVYAGAGTSCTDSSLTPQRMYYYAAFTRDIYGQISSMPAFASAIADWEFIDVTIPALEQVERFPTQVCGPGDCDFGNRGPVVSMTATLRRFERTFWVEVTAFRGAEASVPGSDFSCVQKVPTDTWATSTFVAPTPDAVFDRYPGLASEEERLSYTDTDQSADVIPGSRIIEYAVIVGSTNGNDFCETTEDDTHLHRLVTRPITARFRR